MHTIRNLALSGALLVAAACSADRLTIPNYNSPTVTGLATDANGVQLAATGILVSQRGAIVGAIHDFGIIGRESMDYFPTDARDVTGYVVGIPSPQRLERAGFASGGWAGRFQNIRNAVSLINALNASSLPAGSKSGALGFAKTMRALDLLYIVMGRDSLGAPTDIPTDPTVPSPFVSRDSVYNFIAGTLDAAKADLAAATDLGFTLHSGFAGFDTPAGFLKFNRAIKARVDIYRATYACGAACYTSALAALGESFVTPVGAAATLNDLNTGVYHLFSAASGDQQNGLSFAVTNSIFAHASAVTDAQLKASGQPDDRLTRKVAANATAVSPSGNVSIPATQHFILYTNNASPVAIIRNEELILLRAEAEIGTGNLGAALQDINNVRTVSGGLAPLASLGANPRDALMYEKRFSTLYEGLRWADMRRWGRLGQLPIDKVGQFVAKVQPIPQAECDARAKALPNGCGPNQ